ncbi:antitoxin [Streptosporangium sp. NPDC048047]|uniref:antitoxin n=1 Tax=Streptosporangium sp. NPDC048047 TaxID=3155748 RepID=UPI00342944A3
MSIMQKLKEMLRGNPRAGEFAQKGIDKAEQMARQKSGGKYDDKIDLAAQKAREAAEKMTARPGEPGETGGYGEAGTAAGYGEHGTPPGRPETDTDAPPAPGRPGAPPAP